MGREWIGLRPLGGGPGEGETLVLAIHSDNASPEPTVMMISPPPTLHSDNLRPRTLVGQGKNVSPRGMMSTPCTAHGTQRLPESAGVSRTGRV